jgi:RNA polymerase sigma-70 factor (ECF subfamily)
MNHSPADSSETETLVSRAAEGDSKALAELMGRYTDRLKRMVQLRMDHRLQGRTGASDIVQEALIEAARRLSDYQRNPPMGFFLWLRSLTAERLLNAHRAHVGTQKRDVSREVSLYRRAMPAAHSVSLARQLLGQFTSPTQAIVRAETQLLVQEVLNRMDPVDREILVLKYFEQLSTSEVASELEIKRSTAGKRYIAALKRLKQELSAIPGFDHLQQR